METPTYKTALIVGAGEGLSASLARLFAREKINVALAARKIEKLGALCRETGAHAYACNAASPDDVERLFGLVAREIAAPDLVVYNASGRSRGAARGERAVEEIGAISLKIVNKPMATPNGGSRALWRRGASPASIHRIVSNGTLLAATGRQQSLFHATQLVRA